MGYRIEFDALGRRIEKTINDTTTRYLYDGADIVLEMNENDAATIYYIRTLNMDEPLARIELDSGGNVTGIRFYLADALGSTIALTDEDGDIKTRYNYTPFGEPEVIGDTSDNPFMFTGREYDEGTGLYYYRARYYSWELGRFISEDPIGLAGGINMYAYVGNSPLNFIDPMGLLPIPIVINPILLIVGPPPPIKDPPGLFTIKGDCDGLNDLIENQVNNSCQQVSASIFDVKLRKCILKSCRKGKITCKDNCTPGRLGESKVGSSEGIIKYRSFGLCVNNIKDANIGDIAIHEWAHGCGWEHYGGKGVPGQSGKLPN